MRCPGQDMRYWKEDSVFEAPCPKCSAAVEFFKDETSQRCRRCGHRFRNPKIDLSCAEWCEYAADCLGFAPERKTPSDFGEGAIAGCLIRAVKEEFKGDQDHITHAMLVFQHAGQLASREGGDPRVVLAAALMLEIEKNRSAHSSSGAAVEPLAKTKEILGRIGLGEEVVARVRRIINAFLSGEQIDETEFRIVHDAHFLAGLATERARGASAKSASDLAGTLKTASARQTARSLFGK